MIHIRFASILFLCFSFIACKKKSNDNPFGNVHISKVSITHRGAITHHQIFYDVANNIDSIYSTGDGTSTGHNSSRKFHYYGTSFDVTDETNNTFSVYAYSNGLIFKILVADTIGYKYNGTQLTATDVFSRTSSYPYYTYTRTNYDWKNGDLETVSSGTISYAYSYDGAHNGQPADPLRINDILKYGRSVIRTTHLLTEITRAGVWAEKYFYKFDGSGKITEMVQVANSMGSGVNDTSVYIYTYY